jgi:hypothetical protein
MLDGSCKVQIVIAILSEQSSMAQIELPHFEQ